MGEPLRRIAVLTHYLTEATAAALAELAAAADRLGLELLMPAEEAAKHPAAAELGYRPVDEAGLRTADLCLVFGGDGTILRSLSRLLGTQRAHARGQLRQRRLPGLAAARGLGGRASRRSSPATTASSSCSPSTSSSTASTTAPSTTSSSAASRRATCSSSSTRSPASPSAACSATGSSSRRRPARPRTTSRATGPSSSGTRACSCSTSSPRTRWASVRSILRPDHVITARNVSPLQECEVVADGDVVGRLCCGDEVRVTAGPRGRAPPHAERGVVLPERRGEALRPPRCSLN